jgi:predicted acetyltransferase
MCESRLPERAADQQTVSVRLAGSSERRVIESLVQFYGYELMRMGPPSAVRFDDQDCYPPYVDLGRYWRIKGFHPLLVRVDQRLAGFALVNTHSRRREKVDFNMADFFISREYRGRGVATEVVRLILEQFAGRWEVAVAEQNVATRMFWSRTLETTANVSHLVRHEGDGERWRGPIWSFRNDLKQSLNAVDAFRETAAAWHAGLSGPGAIGPNLADGNPWT